MSGPEAIRVGPSRWWRWAVVSRRFPGIPGVGFWRESAALEFWNRARNETGETPYLLRRVGWRRYEVVR